MDNSSEQNRVEAEKGRVTAEEGRVEAEAGRVHAESNQGSGRVEAEEARVLAEAVRQNTSEEFHEEIEKFASDPRHYISPGAKRIFRRYTYAWIIIALAAIIGVWTLTKESDKRVEQIQQSRIEVTYDSCLESNDRNINTVNRIDELIADRKNEINIQIEKSNDPQEIMTLEQQIKSINSRRDTTVSLINALAPKRDCVAFIIDRFGVPPNLTEQGGE